MADIEALRAKTPIDVISLTGIEGIGPKKARALWQALRVQSVEDLKRAAREGRIRTLPHFGERSEQKILEGVTFYEEAAGRRPLGEVLDVARRIETALAKVPHVVRATVAGSIRRRRDTIGDVDVLVVTDAPERVLEAVPAIPEVQALLAHGPTKILVRLTNGMDADLRVIAPESFGAALMYFTGSKAHNVALRKIAMKSGLKLSEYGLFHDEHRVAGRTEEEVYRALGLSWVPPEMREDTGEVELAQRGTLPRVLEPGEIRGDLQVHTSWTDGAASIDAMARAARQLGREYIVITDHTRDLPMTGGLDEGGLREQMCEVRRVDEAVDGIRVLTGAETNIRPDGSLDVDDRVLADLDVVGAAVHAHFEQSRAEMTRRLVRAIENPHVDILFHPLSRALGRRRAIDFDFDPVLDACLRTGTVLEIDAQPARLDLPDALARAAVAGGVRTAVDSDPHTPDELRFIDEFGVPAARRSWAEGRHLINTLPVDQMLASLKGHPVKRLATRRIPGPHRIARRAGRRSRASSSTRASR